MIEMVWFFMGFVIEFVCCRRLGIRVFHSAPILRRYNDVTLETADGIIVTICGTINRSRMLRNGFTQEVLIGCIWLFFFYGLIMELAKVQHTAGYLC